MHDKATVPAGGGVSPQTAQHRAEGAVAGGPAADGPGEHSVAAISAEVLRLTRRESRLSRSDFAARAGVATDVVTQAEDGTRPAWALPDSEFTALASTVSALSPWMRGMFETAAACDLLLSCILDGGQAFATDVVAGAGSHDLAWAMLRWVVAGPRLGRAQLWLLDRQASALAVSSSPDAWVGELILALRRGDQ